MRNKKALGSIKNDRRGEVVLASDYEAILTVCTTCAIIKL